MVHKRYMRMMIASLLSIIPLTLSMLIIQLMAQDFELVLTTWILLTGLIIIMDLYLLFCYFSTKKHDQGLADLNDHSLRQFIVKTDVWLFKRLLIFDVNGKYVGMTKIEIKDFKSLLLSHLSYYNIIVPLLYKIYDHEGHVVCMFKRAGFKSAIVNIYDKNQDDIGKIEFDEFKTLFKFSGHAFFKDKKYRISSELLFEDAESHLMKLSSFQNRVEYHYIFRDMYNETATLRSPISTEEGKVGLAALVMLYYFRW